ncbi:MAG TPA: PHP domain-containing protein, partial [Tepidisphaeraceae bacterium]|nr:PHP domain-containing protein [Tepidisphaeraceae bacterium]
GRLSPSEVIKLAIESNLSALALTDHDTVDGIAEAAEAARAAGLDFLSGIEISCEYPYPGTLHLLGYGVKADRPVLRDLTKTLLAGRDSRNPKIIARLRELNVAISMDEVENEAGGNVLGRPHIAAILLRKGYVSSIKEAFDKYLAPGGLAYFDKERLTPRQAIGMVLESGGIPVLAHPVQLRTQNDAQLERIVKDLIDVGLAGIEVIHSDHDESMVSKYTELADRQKLLKTGGSDFHGKAVKNIDLGVARGRRIPREFFDALVERLNDSGIAAT